MQLILALLLVVGAAIGLGVMASRFGEVFRLTVHGERVTARGTLPASLRRDLLDVLERARVTRATLRGVRRQGTLRLELSELPPEVAQRLRNVFAVHRL